MFSLLKKYNKRYSCTTIILFYISGPGLKQLEYSDLSFVLHFPVTVFVYLQDHPNASCRESNRRKLERTEERGLRAMFNEKQSGYEELLLIIRV